MNRVFTHENGSPIHPRHLTEAFARLNKASGLPHIRFHDLRHTYARIEFERGTHPKIVSERLSHHSVAFTLDVYTRFAPGDDATTAAGIDSLLFGIRE